MGEIDFNAQGDITIGGDVVSGDKITTTNITNVHAAASLALNLHQLPSPPRDFTGRAAELDELMAAVEAGGVTISGLHGLGGIGKTALALKLAEALTPHYPDAQFYLDLKGVAAVPAGDKPLMPAEALAHVIRAYYPTSKLPDSEAELRGLYHSVLHGKRALLLLDNARDAAQVAPLLPPSGCIAIITARLHFTPAGGRSFNLDQLSSDEAKALIVKIVQRLSAEELAGALDEMAQLCGHLPLALRASASALQERVDLGPTDYLRRLRDENKRLQLEGIKAEGVPISVAASFNLSYQVLTEAQQKLWRALAVFPADFDRAAVAAVWELEPDPAHDALSELVKYSLSRFKFAPLIVL
jgi:predicted ATPase